MTQQVEPHIWVKKEENPSIFLIVYYIVCLLVLIKHILSFSAWA